MRQTLRATFISLIIYLSIDSFIAHFTFFFEDFKRIYGDRLQIATVQRRTMITVWPSCWRGRRAGCCLLRCTRRIWWLSLTVTLINIFTAQTSLDRELDCLVVVFSLTDKRSLDIARNIVNLANQSGQTGQSISWRTKIMLNAALTRRDEWEHPRHPGGQQDGPREGETSHGGGWVLWNGDTTVMK